MTAVEALLQSGAEFNAWRRDCGEDEIDLEGVDLSHRSISGANLSGVNLKAARLCGAVLTDTQFDETILYQADATDAEFVRCRFKACYGAQATLRSARFFQCRLEECRFPRADATDARFEHGAMVRCRFEDARLERASFFGSLLVDNLLPGVSIEQDKSGRTETHLGFHWISPEGDDFALGPLVPGQPYAASIRRYQQRDGEVIKQFARMAAAVIRKHHRLSTCDTVVPVPPRRPSDEVFPNALLAREVWTQAGVKDGTNWLVRHSPVAAGADVYAQRDTLVLSASARSDRRVLLLDDVVSSGATLQACRQVLQDAGVRQVLGLSLAREVPKS
jgi:uncharacterized protein YjbI with pentapeptide repeats